MNSEMSLLTFPVTGVVVRMVGTADRPEWIAQDVATALGIKNVRSTLESFDDEEAGVHTMDGCSSGIPGSRDTQTVLTVTEPGLYRLILKSRKPEAHQFRRWICHEVLPTIRKYGVYPAPIRPLPRPVFRLTHPAAPPGCAEAASALRQYGQAMEVAAGLLNRAYTQNIAREILSLADAAQETYDRRLRAAASVLYAPEYNTPQPQR